MSGILLAASVPVSATALAVSATNATVDNDSGSDNPTVAGIQINNLNFIKKCGADGIYDIIVDSPFVTGGTTSQVWVERTINSGSLDVDTIGASRVACSGTRTIEAHDTSPIPPTTGDANVTVDFYDAASGGTLLDSATYDLTASYDTS